MRQPSPLPPIPPPPPPFLAPARTPAPSHTCSRAPRHLSQAILAALLGIWGLAGLEPRICADSQPQSAYAAVEFSFVAGGTLLCWLNAAVAVAYPIKGERLRLLKDKCSPHARHCGQIGAARDLALSAVLAPAPSPPHLVLGRD